MFMSKTFGGRATDGQIVNKSNLSRVLEPEDKVLSDKAGPAEHKYLDGSNFYLRLLFCRKY